MESRIARYASDPVSWDSPRSRSRRFLRWHFFTPGIPVAPHVQQYVFGGYCAGPEDEYAWRWFLPYGHVAGGSGGIRHSLFAGDRSSPPGLELSCSVGLDAAGMGSLQSGGGSDRSRDSEYPPRSIWPT